MAPCRNVTLRIEMDVLVWEEAKWFNYLHGILHGNQTQNENQGMKQSIQWLKAC